MPAPRTAALLAASWLAACGSSHTAPTGDDGGTRTDAARAHDAGPDAARPDAGGEECTDSRPFCADDCGSDWEPEGASCVDGRWVCPPGTVDSRDCPSGTCWGPPLPGEVCDDGWRCAPDDDDWAACPSLLCATCEGFGDFRAAGTCACTCDPDIGQVTCERVTVPSCEGLGYCDCFEREDCAVQSDGCLCPCDFTCPGFEGCACDCGGGTYLGCAPATDG